MNESERKEFAELSAGKLKAIMFKNAPIAKRVSGKRVSLQMWTSRYDSTLVGKKDLVNTLKEEKILDKVRDEVLVSPNNPQEFIVVGYKTIDDSVTYDYKTTDLDAYGAVSSAESQIFYDLMANGKILYVDSKTALTYTCTSGVDVLDSIREFLKQGH